MSMIDESYSRGYDRNIGYESKSEMKRGQRLLFVRYRWSSGSYRFPTSVHGDDIIEGN